MLKSPLFRTLACLALGALALPAADEEAPLVKGLKDLKKLNRQMVGVGERCMEATVALVSRGGNGSGSGVIVSEDGLVLTAAHVMAALTDEVIVILPDGTRLAAEKLGADFDRDAAMIRITEEAEFSHVKLGDSDALRRNDWCVALGHPGGYDPMRTPPLRLGRVISLGEFLVTDSAVVGGDSGGPLFDGQGRLIGIHSNIGMTLSENRHVPIAVFTQQWDDFLAGKRSGSRFGGEMQRTDPDRAVMGVQLGSGGGKGVEVIGVMDGSPAAKSGLRQGDRILRVGDERVRSREELIGVVNRFKPGDRVEVVARRDGEEQRFTVKLARLGDLREAAENGGSDEEGEADEEKSTEQKIDEFLDEKGKEMKNGELHLELTPEQIEEFGGMENLMKRLKERAGGEAEEKEEVAEEEVEPEQAAAELEEWLDRMFEGGERLELTPEQAKRFGGPAEINRKMRERLEQLAPEELLEMARQLGMATEDPFFESSMKALKPVVKKAANSVAVVSVDGEPAALGTFVNDDGWMLTKDTETAEGEVTVVQGGESYAAERVRRFPAHDLALFKVRGGNFESVSWRPGSQKLGALLTAAGPEEMPLGIGLVSVLPRPLAEVGFLGVGTEDAEKGVRIAQVVPESGAAKAGLKAGDVIVSLNEAQVVDSVGFGASIREIKTGETVRLGVEREGELREVEVTLGERPGLSGPRGARFQRMNEMSGRMSEKTGGFPAVLQHDIPLDPSLCGGPLLDLQGRCVGINVSRAGRVKTYAIPASVVAGLLDGVDEEAITDEEMEAVKSLIDEVRGNLDELEERLEKLEAP